MPERPSSSEEEERHVRETARKLFSSLFFGWTPPRDDNTSNFSSSSSSESSQPRSSNVSQQPQPQPQNRQAYGHKPETTNRTVTEDPYAGLQKQVADQIDKLIPKDPKELRQTAIFKDAYKAIQWQRDNYLVGREYANWRTKERLRLPLDHKSRSISNFQNEIQFDEMALVHGQVAKLAASFIPSETVKAALLPLATPLLHSKGSNSNALLYPFTHRAVIHLIEGQQDNLNSILKNQLLIFLDNPKNRTSIKSSTKGFISTRTYRD